MWHLLYAIHKYVLKKKQHIRVRGDNLLRRVIEGRMLGKPPRGRKRFGMLSDLKGKESYVQLKRRADNRDQWRTWGPGEDEGDDEEDDES